MPDFEEIVIGRPERGKKSSLALFLIVFAVFFGLYRGPAEGYWDTYIAVPAALLTGQKVEFHTASGQPIYDYELSNRLPEDLVNKKTYGIATKDQRLGPAIAAAPLYRFFNLFGFRLFHALMPALTALLFFCFVQRLTPKRWLAFFAGALVVLNPFVLSFQRLNANYQALMLAAAVILVLETDPFKPFVAGLIYGTMGGIRNEAIIYGPIVLVWVWLRGINAGKRTAGRDGPLAATLFFAAGACVAILPILYWKTYAFGSPLAHPSQYAHFEGFRPTFPHDLLGLPFEFNGLLNYPFFDHWVRTPHFPFPVFLMVPLLLLSSFGLLMTALGILGVSPFVRAHRRVALCMAAWLLTTYLFWAFQENWEELKMSFLFLGLPAPVLFIAIGLERFTSVAGLKKGLVPLLLILACATFLLKFAFYLEFPADARWYERFPKAAENDSGLDGLPDELRLEPEFYLTREGGNADQHDSGEYVRLKRKFTQACVLPCEYLPIDVRFPKFHGDPLGELASPLLKARNVWDLIYAQRSRPDGPGL
jgi:hypothetical protein